MTSTGLELLSGRSMVNVPDASVVTEVVEPLKLTVAPERGEPSALYTLPVIFLKKLFPGSA